MIKVVDLNHPGRPFSLRPCGLVLGNFDGVHIGHVALIERLKQQNKSRDEKLALGAFCFEQHPDHFFGKDTTLLCTNEQKMELFRSAGLEFVIFGDFAFLKDMSPEEFATDFLINSCQCHLAVCGFNYSFGAKGAGTPEQLVRCFEAHKGRRVSIVPPVTVDGASVSSTTIREMLKRGRWEDAARLLGREVKEL